MREIFDKNDKNMKKLELKFSTSSRFFFSIPNFYRRNNMIMILNVKVLQIEPPKDDSSVETVVLDPKLTTFEERSEKLAIVLEELRKKDVFFTLKGWRDEVMTAVCSRSSTCK